jgi:hypothetical protein
MLEAQIGRPKLLKSGGALEYGGVQGGTFKNV